MSLAARRTFSLVSAADGQVRVACLEVADGWWSRFWGLQFRREFPAGHGLLLVPCGSIHTCWLRFAIDAVALDRGGAVLSIGTAIPPWRTHFFPSGTHAVLELPVGSPLPEVGECLQLGDEHTEALPASLAWLSSGRTD